MGYNSWGQLGLGHQKDTKVATPIPNLPRIMLIACSSYASFCVDEEGILYSFGKAHLFSSPQKMNNFPPVVSITCGGDHTLFITNDSNLWSFGNNGKGQLFQGQINESVKHILKPKQTLFSNIVKISAGLPHSFFQDDLGNIFGCGDNSLGQLGEYHDGIHYDPVQLNEYPLHIIQFCSGSSHSLFLDNEGNVYSIGNNNFGSLGRLGDNNSLLQILNIPPIQYIACVGISSLLIDMDENLWVFGNQEQINGWYTRRPPTKVSSIKNIQQVSSGCCGGHFLTLNSKNEIFVTGSNGHGQLGITNSYYCTTWRRMDSTDLPIWGQLNNYSKAKSARN